MSATDAPSEQIAAQAAHMSLMAMHGHARNLNGKGRLKAPRSVRFDAWQSYSSTFKIAMKASCGTSTLPIAFMRFLPAFCFSSSLRLREMSPP